MYAIDLDDPRGRRAADLIVSLLEAGRLRVSVQVLREFFVVTTRKVARPLTIDEALAIIDELSANGVVSEDAAMVRHAAALHAAHRLSFWDALIVAAAVRSGATELFSEDLNAGQWVEGVRIVDPFADVGQGR